VNLGTNRSAALGPPHDQIEDWRQNPEVIEIHDDPSERRRLAAKEITFDL
jgi:hypothetical protein